MRILVVGPMPPLVTGQALANKMAVEGLRKIGNDVVVVNTAAYQHILSFRGKKLDDLGKVFDTIASLLRYLVVLFSRLDVVYFTPGQSVLGFLRFAPLIVLSNLMRIPISAHIHGGSLGKTIEENPKSIRVLMIYFLRKVDQIIVLSDSLRKMLDGKFDQKKIATCANGVEDDFFVLPEDIRTKSKNVVPRLLFLSNLTISKGIIDFLHALLLLQKDGVIFQADIAGTQTIEAKKDVEELLSRLGTAVKYHGVVLGEDKKKLLRNANVFILPTYYGPEGQPISILEAYASGCAVVTTDQGGILDIFQDTKNGYLTLKRNPQHLKETIIKAVSKSEGLGCYNLQFAKNNFTRKKFVDRIQNALQQLVHLEGNL